MSGEIGDLSQGQIKTVVKSLKGNQQIIPVLKAIGQERPKASREELEARLKQDKELRQRRESRTGSAQQITISERKISSGLELQPLLLGTLLTTGSWKQSFLKDYYHLSNKELANQLPSQAQCDNRLKRIQEEIGEEGFIEAVSQHLAKEVDRSAQKERASSLVT